MCMNICQGSGLASHAFTKPSSSVPAAALFERDSGDPHRKSHISPRGSEREAALGRRRVSARALEGARRRVGTTPSRRPRGGPWTTGSGGLAAGGLRSTRSRDGRVWPPFVEILEILCACGGAVSGKDLGKSL